MFWGQDDIFFTREGGEAYLADLPEAEMHRLDSGHFAVEDCLPTSSTGQWPSTNGPHRSDVRKWKHDGFNNNRSSLIKSFRDRGPVKFNMVERQGDRSLVEIDLAGLQVLILTDEFALHGCGPK